MDAYERTGRRIWRELGGVPKRATIVDFPNLLHWKDWPTVLATVKGRVVLVSSAENAHALRALRKARDILPNASVVVVKTRCEDGETDCAVSDGAGECRLLPLAKWTHENCSADDAIMTALASVTASRVLTRDKELRSSPSKRVSTFRRKHSVHLRRPKYRVWEPKAKRRS
jgi:hypothetical protein